MKAEKSIKMDSRRHSGTKKRQWELLKSNFLTFVLHHGFQKHIFFSFPNQETKISFKLWNNENVWMWKQHVIFKSLHLCLSWSKLLMIWFLCSMTATSSSICCCSWSRSFWLQSLSVDDGVRHLTKQVDESHSFASNWPHLGQAPAEVSDLFVIRLYTNMFQVRRQNSQNHFVYCLKKKKSLLLREKKNQLSMRVLYTMFKIMKIYMPVYARY